MELIYVDDDIIVCVKPAGVVSTDQPGGVPELARQALGDEKADVRTVHRLDQVVSGLMVLARNPRAASELSRQIREDAFGKAYLAIVKGGPEQNKGRMYDLLLRDKRERKTYVVQEMAKGVQEAVLEYEVIARTQAMSRVAIRLITGRTHQIRAQFSSRGMALIGDKKYGAQAEGCDIALWSAYIGFTHPVTGKKMEFRLPPPECYPWTVV